MKLKKMMAVTLATTMLMSASMTVCAADDSGGSGGSGNSGSCIKPVVTTTEIADEAASEEENVASAEVIQMVDTSKLLSASAKVNVGGRSVATTVAGAYLAAKVNGVAIVTPEAELAAKLNLKPGQKAYVMVYDFDQKKSNLAMNSISMAAEALGADFVAAINVNLGAKENGKFVTLADGSVKMTVGIPKTAVDASKTYAVIGVQPGGAITYYEDLDADASTVTFDVKAGLGAYAIVVK